MNPTTRNLLLWSVIATSMFIIFQMFPGNAHKPNVTQIPYSQFMQEAASGKIDDVNISGQHAIGRYKDGKPFLTYVPDHTSPVSTLVEKGVTVRAMPLEEQVSLLQMIIPWIPIILIGILMFYSFRQIQSGGNRAMGFGKSRAKLLGDRAKVTFTDVAGIDEAKAELQEIVDFLKDPQKFQRLGGKIPKGVLLVGPPGTGKTLLARAIAGEAEVPFFSISGSDFVEMFVGVGASRVRDMFEQAKKSAPCIVFIDEIDAVGRHRGVGMGGGNDEREQTLNQLLVEMDGFEENQGIIIVAATNRPDILDPALLRPGRFDRQVVVPNPDVNGREQILKVHMRKVPLAPNVDPRVIARGTPGFSGADLANLINEAALMAARRGKLAVGMTEFELAKDKVMMGAERRSLVMSDNEKKLTAYHEAGHAIVGYYLPDSDPIHKATIIPRGRALGMVMRLPENDRISVSRSKLISDIMVAMGGRIAEEMTFGYDKVTTGASSDIKMATDVARRMITEWGMSDKLGFQSYAAQEEGYLGSHTTQKSYSGNTAQLIDEEVKQLIGKCYVDTEVLLKKKKKHLILLAENLLERETLSGEDIRIVLDGGILPPMEDGVPHGDTPPISSVPSTNS